MNNSLLHPTTFNTEQTAFLHIILSISGLILFVTIGSNISRLLRPHRPGEEKRTTYESGSEPLGNAWNPFDSRLYIWGLIFILFELETILLFPWATIWVKEGLAHGSNKLWNVYMALVGSFFIIMLGIGLIYALIKGQLATRNTLAKPHQISNTGPIPFLYYEKINATYAKHTTNYK